MAKKREAKTEPDIQEKPEKVDLRYLEELQALDVDQVIRLDEELTAQEKLFMSLYVKLNKGDDRAAKLRAVDRAGYKVRWDQTRLVLADAIIAKYCVKSQEHKQVFRTAGLDEFYIALSLKRNYEGCQSETARAQFANIITKCMGLQKDVQDFWQGVELIIKRKKGESLDPVEQETGVGPKKSEGAKPKGRLVVVEGQVPNE
jgi:hypothetical protein